MVRDFVKFLTIFSNFSIKNMLKPSRRAAEAADS